MEVWFPGTQSYDEITVVLNSIVPHPSYDPATLNNDVIVFKLQRKVDYRVLPNVFPACWPTLSPTVGTTVRCFS